MLPEYVIYDRYSVFPHPITKQHKETKFEHSFEPSKFNNHHFDVPIEEECSCIAGERKDMKMNLKNRKIGVEKHYAVCETVHFKCYALQSNESKELFGWLEGG